MNKGMILELRGEVAIVLTPEGEFRSIKKRKQQTWQIGAEVDLPPASDSAPQLKRKKRVFIPSIALAASLLLVVVSMFAFLPFVGDQTAIAYVNVDINPSVEISINKSLEVIDLVGLNQEGKQIISSMEGWLTEPLDQVTTNMIMIARHQGFLTENQDVLVSTSFVDEQSEGLYIKSVDLALEEVEKKVEQASEAAENQVNTSTDKETDQKTDHRTDQNQATDNKKNIAIKVHQLKTNKEIRNEAKEKGISSGKYSIYLKAVEQGVEIDLEEVAESSISQLAQKLKGLDTILSNSSSKKKKDEEDKSEKDDDNEENGKRKGPNHDKEDDDREEGEQGKKHPRENGKQKGKKDKEDDDDDWDEDRDEDRDDDEDDDDKKRGKPDHPGQGNKGKKGPPHKDKGNSNGKGDQEESKDHIELDLELQQPRIPGILNQVPGLIHDGKGDKQRGRGDSDNDKEKNDNDDDEDNEPEDEDDEDEDDDEVEDED
jgi:hypothetical protein